MKYFNEDGTLEEWAYDEASGKMTHRTSHDVTALVESNKREFNDSTKQYKKPMEKIASIDGYAAHAWCLKNGVKYEEFLRDIKIVYRFLADPDNAVWKTKNARLKH